MVEVGKWYEFCAEWPPYLKGRPILVIGLGDEGIVIGRWADGHERICFVSQMCGPIAGIRAGVTEACTTCGGKKMIPHYEPREDEPWFLSEVGRKPCPNCYELLTETI
jgi:hypothetical protein